MKPLVLLPEQIADCGVDLLERTCFVVAPWRDRTERHDDLAFDNAMSRAEAIIVRIWPVREKELDRMPTLRVIVKHGVGIDNIDEASASRRGIPVVITPDAVTASVAEYTMALLLAMARRVVSATAQAPTSRSLIGIELHGKVLGIVGLGRIGQYVARMGQQGFGMRVVAFDPFVRLPAVQPQISLVSSLEELLAEADVVTLHLPLTPGTKHLLDDQRLRLLKSSAYVINTARGGIIDDRALARALEEGRLAGAGLDVLEAAEGAADQPILRAPNVIITPHLASSTTEALEKTAILSAQAVLKTLDGELPAGVINREFATVCRR